MLNRKQAFASGCMKEFNSYCSKTSHSLHTMISSHKNIHYKNVNISDFPVGKSYKSNDQLFFEWLSTTTFYILV